MLLGLLLLVATALGIASYTLWRLRADALANGLKVAALQAYSFEDFLTQNLRISELAVDNIMSADNPIILWAVWRLWWRKIKAWSRSCGMTARC